MGGKAKPDTHTLIPKYLRKKIPLFSEIQYPRTNIFGSPPAESNRLSRPISAPLLTCLPRRHEIMSVVVYVVFQVGNDSPNL